MTWLTLLNKGGPYFLVLGVIAGIAFGGWTARGWYEGNLELERMKATKAAVQTALDHHSGVARAVEAKLSTLKANQTVIDRGVTREVIKPVYRNLCLPGTGVRLLNAAALNDLAGVPAEPDGQVPGNAAAPE